MEENTQHFLDLIRRSHRGRFKIYIGMIAGVGKTFRMLQDAREMLRQGTDVQIGYVETHGRPDTVKALRGLPVIPRKKVFYKGKGDRGDGPGCHPASAPRDSDSGRTGPHQCGRLPPCQTMARRNGTARCRYQCDYGCQHPTPRYVWDNRRYPCHNCCSEQEIIENYCRN